MGMGGDSFCPRAGLYFGLQACTVVDAGDEAGWQQNNGLQSTLTRRRSVRDRNVEYETS